MQNSQELELHDTEILNPEIGNRKTVNKSENRPQDLKNQENGDVSQFRFTEFRFHSFPDLRLHEN